MKDIKSLYLAAKNSEGKNDILSYSEAVQMLLENSPNDYILNLEYIISSDIGLRTLKPFVEKHGLPIMCYDNVMEVLEKCQDKCNTSKKDDTEYKEAISYLESFRQKYIGCFMMESYFHDQLPDNYVSVYYGANQNGIPNRKLAAGIISKFGEAAIPDVLVTAHSIGGSAMETAMQFIDSHNTIGNPVICEWVLEAVKNTVTDVTPVMKHMASKSIRSIVDNMNSRNHQVYREAVITGSDDKMFEYSEDEVKAINDLISLNEYKLLWANEMHESVIYIQNQIYCMYEELDGIIDLDGDCEFFDEGANIEYLMEKLSRNEYVMASFKKKYNFNPSDNTITVDGKKVNVIFSNNSNGTGMRASRRIDDKNRPRPTLCLGSDFFSVKDESRRDAIIQHEIGHAVLGHIGKTTLFDDKIQNDDPKKNLKSNREKAIASVMHLDKRDPDDDEEDENHTNTKEFEADRYAANRTSTKSMKAGLRDVSKYSKKHPSVENTDYVPYGLYSNYKGEYIKLHGSTDGIIEFDKWYDKNKKIIDKETHLEVNELRKNNNISGEIDKLNRSKALKTPGMRDSGVYKKEGYDFTEDIATSVVPMIPGVGNTQPIEEGQWLLNTRNKKTGEIPGYLKRNHNIGYGEDDGTTPEKTDLHGDPISDDSPVDATLDDFKRPSFDDTATPYSGLEDEKDKVEDSISTTTAPMTQEDRNAINNFYYYTYNNSLNKNNGSFNKDGSNHDDHSTHASTKRTIEDHSKNKRINSDNINGLPEDAENVDQPVKESKDPCELNIFGYDDLFNEKVGDADKDRPESDHPVKDVLTDIDRNLVKKQQGAKKTVQNVQNAGRAFVKPIGRTKQWLTNMVNNWKDTDENNIKEKMADPHARSNLFSGIKKAVVGGSLIKAGILLNPVFLFLSATRGLGKNKREFRIRTEMIGELKTELEVIDEKIKDADRVGDNKEKYKLMRFKNELNKKLLRVGGGQGFGKKRWADIV